MPAKRRPRASVVAPRSVAPVQSPPADGVFDPTGLPTGPTGRYLVVLRDVGQTALVKTLKDVAGLAAETTADFERAAVRGKDLAEAEAMIFEQLGVAVVQADRSQVSALEGVVSDNSNPVLAVEPEEYVYALDEREDALVSAAGLSYLRGYQDAVNALVAAIAGAMPGEGEAGEAEVAATFADTAGLTWGLQATSAARSSCTGRGIRVAVLDTGMDLKHPDFGGRSPVTASFVPGEAVQDGHGHGTHCIGTSCGPKVPAGTPRRYGIATEATILAGKVLSNAGSGQDSWILAGINWAIQNRAVVISMSLGAPVAPGQGFKQAYEQAAQAALNAGALIVAAAGNSGNQPVGSPANCPSIMAVAAVDANLQRAAFSCIGINPNGGEVDIAGPGVAVFSSTKLPTRYATMSGTSMATPHVAGCAALWAQSSGLRAKPLWNQLVSSARAIGLPAQQAGAGLVQAPSCRKVLPPRPIPIPGPIRPLPR
jgi:subtilisin family serine protease